MASASRSPSSGRCRNCGTGRTRLLSCTPERLRAKGEEWLARYRLAVEDEGAEARSVVVVGNLYGPLVAVPSGDESVPATDRYRRALRRGGVELLAGRSSTPAAGRRPRIPPFLLSQDIIDPVAARDLLQHVIVDAGYGDAVVSACQPEVVRYKPGSRCTVVVGVDYDRTNGNQPGPDPIVIKTHQGDKGQTAWAAMTALWQSPLARQGVVTLAEPLGYDPERRILFQGPIPEDCTLKELARNAIADGGESQLDRLREELAKTGYAWLPCTSPRRPTGRPRPWTASWRNSARWSVGCPSASHPWRPQPSRC